ncbi:MAG: hypothetical protein FVQ81_15875 [Candidatus Glassbacteria bacterium]|nr:hypothetical protein [Candidatus Glassbacteria bacterium]
MREQKQKFRLILLAAVLLAPSAGLYAQGGDVTARVDSLEARIDSLGTIHDSLAEVRAKMLIRSSDLAARGDRLRGSPGRTPGPLDKYRLNSVLAASQSLADSLDMVNTRLDNLQQEIDGYRLDAVVACTAALDSLSRLMIIAQAAPRSNLARQFEALRGRRKRLAAVAGGEEEPAEHRDLSRVSLVELAGFVKIGASESLEEIAEKSAFLSDIESRWSRALAALEHNIGRLDEEREMRTRLGEFAQELALFDETGPSSRAGVAGPEGSDQSRTLESGGPEMDRMQGYQDFSLTPKQMAESLAFDIQLADPETELRLMQELDRFSTGDIADLVELLQARRDSLAADLVGLRRLHEELRQKTGLD